MSGKTKADKKRHAKWCEAERAAGRDPKPQHAKAPKDHRREIKVGRQPDPPKPKAGQADAFDPIAPTAERMAKNALAERGTHKGVGMYRSPPPIERMRDKGTLDHDPSMNEAMYNEAQELHRLYRVAGMGGIGAQDLSRIIGVGGDAAHMMPASERAAAARIDLVRRLNLMGWYPHMPLRGAGRTVYAVICLELPLAEAGRLHCGVSETKRAEAVAKDRLREGLMALVDYSRSQRRRMAEDARVNTAGILGQPVMAY